MRTTGPLVLLACGGGAADSVDATLGGMRVHVEADPARVVVAAADGTPLFDGLPAGIEMRHGDASYQFQFGSFRITERSTAPWRPVARLANARVDGRAIRFDLAGEGGATLGAGAVAEAADGEVTITFTAAATADDRVRVALACDPDEHFLGLGGQSFDVDHRGQTVPLWVQEDGITKDSTDDYAGIWELVGRRHSTHTPMPIYLSSRGYALWLDTPYRSIFALCSDDPAAVRVEAWEPEVRLHLFAGPEPARAVERLTARVGRPSVPPAFAFAPWLDAIFGSDNVRRVAAKLRAERVPSSVIWTEDWRGGGDTGTGYALRENWEVDRTLYPDFEAVAADLHAQGFKWLTYNNTFLVDDADVHGDAVARGVTIRDGAGAPYTFTGATFRPTTLVDLSGTDAVAWTKDRYREGLRLGADGWMADYGEWLPTDARLASGDAIARHNLYPVDFQRLNRELLDEEAARDGVERLFFVRSAYVGSQGLVSVVWAGDQQTDFSDGDGFPSVIPIGLGLGVTGFPYFGSDIAGYMSQLTTPSTRELWFRWVTLGALSPVMRTHHGRSARDNWSWERDDESTALLRRWASFHMRLLPYLLGLARDASATGAPMMRPLAWAWPAFPPGWTARDEYLLGDRLIVAPVVTQGATSRAVALPGGTFFRLGGGPVTVPAGGGDVSADVALDDIAVFVPAGALLPLLPDGVDTAVDATSGAVTLTSIGDDRELWLWPGGDSAFTEAGGLAYAWSAASLASAPSSATWNGAPVAIVDGAVSVTGAGRLVVNAGAATLDVTGGASERRITVRFR